MGSTGLRIHSCYRRSSAKQQFIEEFSFCLVKENLWVGVKKNSHPNKRSGVGGQKACCLPEAGPPFWISAPPGDGHRQAGSHQVLQVCLRSL